MLRAGEGEVVRANVDDVFPQDKSKEQGEVAGEHADAAAVKIAEGHMHRRSCYYAEACRAAAGGRRPRVHSVLQAVFADRTSGIFVRVAAAGHAYLAGVAWQGDLMDGDLL